MSLLLRRRVGKNLDEAKLKIELNNAIGELNRNHKVIDKLMNDVCDVEDILTKENELILEHIDRNVQIIRQALNEYVLDIQTDLKRRLDHNFKCLHDLQNNLRHELTTCTQDKAKCETTLKDLDTNDESNVNKTKVVELVLGSITALKYIPPVCELKKTVYVEPNDDQDIVRHISKLTGTLKSRIETLQEVKHPADLVRTFDIPDREVNAMAIISDKSSTNIWINQSVSTELARYSHDGKLRNTIYTDFKVNDIDVNVDGKILATSTDSYRLRCLKPMKNGKHMQMYSITDKLYLHSIAVSNDGETVVACGTDAPNYTNQAPNEVVIVEYSPPGKELKRVAISGYTGKVYRFVQNVDNNYVLTFPKDGKILSVNGLNGVITASFDTSDFRRCLPKHNTAEDKAVFWPSGLSCNLRGHIFVTEWVHKYLLMFDKDCHFLRHIGLNHSCPNAVCYDESSQTIWLGDKGKIKVWEMKRNN